MMKKLYRYLILAPVYALLTTAVFAQCSGIQPAGTLCGNSGATGALAAPTRFLQTGTGAVPRTWNAKTAEALSVEDFGASTAASAATNNTAFALAITAALAQNNRPVTTSAGTYNLSANLTVGSIEFRGAGKTATTLNFSGGTGIVVPAGASPTIRHLTITTSGTGLTIGDGSDYNYFVTINNVAFLNNQIGIFADSMIFSHITESDFEEYTLNGIVLQATIGTDAGDSIISNNHFRTNAGVSGGASEAAIKDKGGGGWKLADNKMVGGKRGWWVKINGNTGTSRIFTANSIHGMSVSTIQFTNDSAVAGIIRRTVIADNEGGVDTGGTSVLFEGAGGRKWNEHVTFSNNSWLGSASAAGYDLDGIADLNLMGGHAIDLTGGTTAVIVRANVDGFVDLPRVNNYTTRYTNASSSVKVIDRNDGLVVNANAARPPAGPTGTVFQVAGANGSSTFGVYDGFAASPGIVFRRANTSAAAPSAVQVNEFTGGVLFGGYKATDYTAAGAPGAQLLARATETYTDTATGTRLNFYTTPNGTAAPALAFALDQDKTAIFSGPINYGGVALSNAVTGTGKMVLDTSPVLVTPNLGTPSAATLTNATGLPISSGVSGLGANVAAFLGTPSSANLATALTDEAGSGTVAFTTEGTWTPTIIGSTSGGWTFGTQNGTYERIGRLVIARFTALSNGSSSPLGNIQIGGLPVAAGGSGTDNATCHFVYQVGMTNSASYTTFGGLIAPGTSVVSVYESGSGVTSQVAAVARATGNPGFIGTCMYHS